MPYILTPECNPPAVSDDVDYHGTHLPSKYQLIRDLKASRL